MSGKPFRPIAVIFFILLLTSIGLVILNSLAGRVVNKPDERIARIQTIYEEDPHNIFRLKPGVVADLPVGVYGPFEQKWAKADLSYRVQINGAGFRCPSIASERATDIPRIAFLGDSSTFGWDVDYALTFIVQTKILLERNGIKVQVLNAGVPGYSTHQGLWLLENRVLDYQPDLLVISFARNDEIDVTFNPDQEARTLSDSELMPRDLGPGAYREKLQASSPSLSKRLKGTGLYRFLRRKIVAVTQKDSGGHESNRVLEVKRRVSIAEYYTNLQSMAQLAHIAGAQVVFLDVGSTTKEYPQAMRQVAEKYQAPFVDAWTLFNTQSEAMRSDSRFAKFREGYSAALDEELFNDPKNFWLVYSTDFAHPNAIGHQVIADELFRIIWPLLSQ